MKRSNHNILEAGWRKGTQVQKVKYHKIIILFYLWGKICVKKVLPKRCVYILWVTLQYFIKNILYILSLFSLKSFKITYDLNNFNMDGYQHVWCVDKCSSIIMPAIILYEKDSYIYIYI